MILAFIKAISKATISELLVVCDFPEVFPNDISDLSLKHDVEFAIYLVSGTSLVTMASYRMLASKLGDLKKQLEDLLEKA